MLAVLIVVAVLSSLWAVSRTYGGWEGLALNFGTEMAGAVVTYVLLELVIGRWEGREGRKADLIMRLGSSVRDIAAAAADELGHRYWLFDGSLRGANLFDANLQEANLGTADLQGANLIASNLQGAKLWEANLQEAVFHVANLQGAKLEEANLRGASLVGANLQGANLERANLQEADLFEANLQEANLCDANLQGAWMAFAVLREIKFNENTILPDGTRWTPDTDMARYTDLKHPDFWRPDQRIGR